MNPRIACLIFSFLLLPFGVDASFAQRRTHSVYFEGTDHELHVFRIHGEQPGKTLLLIGGIQGDEPGGFLSADHYADISLARGNLIVVPRANFPSIVLQRRKINEDMNRKFATDRSKNFETEVVAILKRLIAESDGLLNLHDGSGYYSDKWEGRDRNPMKYGQSVIADCETYMNPKTGTMIHLGAMARLVVKRVNVHIENAQHHFHFNNHRTVEESSPHREQRKSATYYALHTYEIPAFGIESSKSLPLELKVRHHNLVINAFMDLFRIIPSTPGLNLENPVLDYLIISVNGSLPVAVKNKQTLSLGPDDTIMISHIEANYDRGLTADIVGYGSINDMREEVRMGGPTKIVVRKDYLPCGEVYLALGQKQADQRAGIAISDKPGRSASFLTYRIMARNKEKIYPNYGRLKLAKGDKLKIVDVITNIADPGGLTVNFKGFVGNSKNNTGEDRGYLVDTGRDLLKRHSLNNEGKRYQIVVTRDHDRTILGKLYIDLEDTHIRE